MLRGSPLIRLGKGQGLEPAEPPPHPHTHVPAAHLHSVSTLSCHIGQLIKPGSGLSVCHRPLMSAVKTICCQLVRLRSVSSLPPSVHYLTARRETCTEPSHGLLAGADKGVVLVRVPGAGWSVRGCASLQHPASHSAMERSWSRQDACSSPAVLPSSHLGSVWISGGPTMSAREKGTPTKDSVSLLPCFYFVEVGSCCMLLTDSRSASPSSGIHSCRSDCVMKISFIKSY